MSRVEAQPAAGKPGRYHRPAGRPPGPAAFPSGTSGTAALPSLAPRGLRATLAAVCSLFVLEGSAVAQSGRFHVGRMAETGEIAAWDLSVTPDGTGLPEGRGRALEGEEVYRLRCAECHGERGEGGDAEAIAGGFGTLRSPRPLKTVGSYWPHATTVWDYVNRAMPFDRPGMLTSDQVYSVVAYVLYLNGIVDRADELNSGNLADVRMPNRDAFVPASSLDAAVEPSRPASPRN